MFLAMFLKKNVTKWMVSNEKSEGGEVRECSLEVYQYRQPCRFVPA